MFSWLKFAWSPGPFDRLPNQIVVKILGNLSIGDRVRLSLVCKSWRSILSRPDLPVKPEPPWEILFDEPEDNFLFRSKVHFRSIHDQRTYTFKLPNAVPSVPGSSWWRWHCCGSGGGWLLMAGHNGFQTEMMLWDPLSGATKKLPSLSTLPFFDDMWEDLLCSFTARAVVFSVGSAECIVGVIFVLREKLGFGLCTPRDRSWCSWPFEEEYLQDILFHNGKLYVVHNVMNTTKKTDTDYTSYEPVIRTTDHLVRLSCCDVQMIVLGLTYGLPYYEPYHPFGFNVIKRYSVVDHLVGSTTGGELLIVSAIVDLCTYMSGPEGPVRSYECPKTGGFEVRRLCVKENDGSCYLERMRDLGDQYVLLGRTGSTCVAGYGQRRNFISFVTNDLVGEVYDDDDEEEGVDGPGKPYVVHEIGVFYMANDEIEIEYSANLRYPPGLFAGFFAPKVLIQNQYSF